MKVLDSMVSVMEPVGSETDEVAVKEPTVRLPTDEDEVMVPPYKSIGDVVAEYVMPESEVGVKG